MNLSDAEQIARRLCEQMSPYCERISIAGSIRRRKADVKDIEIVAIPKWESVEGRNLFDPEYTRKNLLSERWASSGSVTWIKPGTKEIVPWKINPEGKYWRGLVGTETQIKLDIFMATAENWGVILAIRTGSAEFSKALVTHAKSVGYPVDGGYLTRNGDRIEVKEELRLFEKLGLEWAEPEGRIDSSAIRMKR